ncbi:MAG: calcineurin-like phosphoesterase C-terminal domain-containing protein, partial [Bacteroidales bacterium]|nr:calcineurin-like phosphoesterase C-terminal domain-containing protein [Bacteroidales bacterium]
ETYSFGQIPFVVENVITGNVAGHVVTSDGLPLSGVVVTDGFSCTSTDEFGFFQMESDLSKVRFIYISTPSGYEPPRRGGVPVFYIETGTLSAKQLQDLTFTLTARNHDKYTVFFTADPQPRNRTNGYDKIAYHSLDVCEDLYTDLRKNAASITDRPVYGICLGDIVHNTLSLLDDYTNGLATLGYPTYNVIGNHDYDRAASDDEKGGLVFEKYFGPLNYSFNLGNVHVLILDYLLMATDASTGKLTTVHYGLSDDTMTWLRNDLEYVSKDKTLFVCSHSPMFRFRKQEFSTGSGTRNGKEYATLLSSYPKVHIWSGHKHATFNYIYPSSGLYPGMECHSLARSTGPLWTNEYVVSGTPRGYTVVDVAGDEISWRFHPLQYQTAQYVRSSAPPAYEHRDWSYNSEGVAILRNGKELDESYQMKVYARGVYGDNYIYANIFLYDDLWGPVFFTPDGGSPVEMSRWTDAGRYDYATAEMTLFYKTDSSVLEDDSSWEDLATGYTDTIFRTPVDIGSGSGTVSATDRFGKTWTCRIEW